MSRPRQPRRMTWMRQVRALPIATFHAPGDGPPLTADVTWEPHSGPVLYDDGGPWVVIDTVPGLEWAVVDTRNNTSERVPLSLKDACNRAYDLNCAERRY